MSEHSQPTLFAETELELMSFVADFHAKTSARRENLAALRRKEAASGPKLSDSFATLDPGSSSWRTSQTCLSGGLEEFSQTWPRSGWMCGGVVCELAILEPRTSEIGFGLLPTPRAAKRGARRPETAIASLKKRGRTKAHKLEDALAILEGRTGVPSPPYVEWMMGFEETWTAFPPLATPSSPKFQK